MVTLQTIREHIANVHGNLMMSRDAIQKTLRLINSPAPGHQVSPAGQALTGSAGDAELLDAYSQAVIGVVEAMGPAVVSVSAGGVSTAGNPEAAATGSGVLITPDGYILTNDHVVHPFRKTGRLAVQTGDGQFQAAVEGTDPATDLAVIRAEASGLPYAPLGDSDVLKTGQLVVAMGNPLGFQSTVSTGVVSAMGRALRARNGRLIENVIQHTAPLNPGNSGGPLLTSRGRVVGINTAIIAMAQGIGFAVPGNTARWVVSQLLQYGRVRRGFLGIAARRRPLSRRVARHFKLANRHTVEVLQVEDAGPAHKAGVGQGDWIVGVDGHPVESVDDLHRHLAQWPIGRELTLAVIRDRQLTERVVVPGEERAAG
jgi:S1-C subfamily serine protease